MEEWDWEHLNVNPLICAWFSTNYCGYGVSNRTSTMLPCRVYLQWIVCYPGLHSKSE